MEPSERDRKIVSAVRQLCQFGPVTCHSGRPCAYDVAKLLRGLNPPPDSVELDALAALGFLERHSVLIHDGKVEHCEYSLPETAQGS
jgi:hypothetical protein